MVEQNASPRDLPNPFPRRPRNDRLLVVRLPHSLYAEVVALGRVYGVTSTSDTLRTLLRRAIDEIRKGMSQEIAEQFERERRRAEQPASRRRGPRAPENRR